MSVWHTLWGPNLNTHFCALEYKGLTVTYSAHAQWEVQSYCRNSQGQNWFWQKEFTLWMYCNFFCCLMFCWLWIFLPGGYLFKNLHEQPVLLQVLLARMKYCNTGVIMGVMLKNGNTSLELAVMWHSNIVFYPCYNHFNLHTGICPPILFSFLSCLYIAVLAQ